MKRSLILAGLVAVISSGSVAHAGTIRLDESLDKLPIGHFVEFFKDESGTLTVADLAGPGYADRWFATTDQYPGFGWTKAALWARFTVTNETGGTIPFYLEHEYPLIDNLQVHEPDGRGGYHPIQTGDAWNFSRRPLDHRTFVFPLECAARSSQTYYVRQESSSSMNYPLVLWSPAAFGKWRTFEDRMLMMYYGFIIIMILNYLCVYFLIRHLSYLYFALFISSMLLFIMTQTGTMYQFIIPNSPVLSCISTPFFLCLTNIFGCQFVIVFLQMRKTAPTCKTVLNIQTILFLTLLCSVGMIPLFNIYHIIMPVTAYSSIVTVIIALSAGVYLVLKKQRIAYIFAPLSFMFLIGSILYVMKTFGMLQGNFITTWLMVIGSAMCLLVLSIAMVDRIHIMRAGLKRLSEKLERQVKARNIELLLSEVASKIMEHTADERRNVDGGAYTTTIQNILNNQRELTIQKLSKDITIISNFDELLGQVIWAIREIAGVDSVRLFMQAGKELTEYRPPADPPRDGDCGYPETIIDTVRKSGTYFISGTCDSLSTGVSPGPAGRGVLCVPIQSAGTLLGACLMEKKPPAEFSVRDATIIMELFDTIAGVFENALSYRSRLTQDEPGKDRLITSQTEDKIKQAVEYLGKNYLREISREGLAASLNISPNHLGKYFKMYTGKRINEYINDLRIQEAAARLKADKDENVVHIAFSVGFESLSTFNRTFLKVMGITPTEYKDRC